MGRPFVGMHQAGFTFESLVIQPVGQPATANTPTSIATNQYAGSKSEHHAAAGRYQDGGLCNAQAGA